MALGVAGLIVAEFLPAGLLTPMARTFGITEGAAGQAVTATSVVAVLASLGIAYATQRHDRRRVLLGLSALLVLANGMVALAPSYAVLLVGRLVLGVALGGFWSMTTAVAARLVPPDQLGRALSIIFGASSFAAVLAAPSVMAKVRAMGVSRPAGRNSATMRPATPSAMAQTARQAPGVAASRGKFWGRAAAFIVKSFA
jgi:predicted MFS family arabinose efflux permease